MPYTYIVGGASSGKSRFALQIFEGRTDVSFIATGVRTDEEMASRIDAHRKERPGTWETIEEPTRLLEAAQRAMRDNGALVIDCLTMWVANLCFMEQLNPEDIIEQAYRTASYLHKLDREIVVVTNEIGMGVIPATGESREFRRIAGEVNRIFADASDAAYLVVSGIGMRIK
jgi:adenosyl cobinamide kinase/adenosyl cobinamide phosphate guanylyltransferase